MAAVAAMHPYLPPPSPAPGTADQQQPEVYAHPRNPSIFSSATAPVPSNAQNTMPHSTAASSSASSRVTVQDSTPSASPPFTINETQSTLYSPSVASLFNTNNAGASSTTLIPPQPATSSQPTLASSSMTTSLLDMLRAASSGTPSMDGPHFVPVQPSGSGPPLFGDESTAQISPAKMRTKLALEDLDTKARKLAGEEYDAMLERRGDPTPSTPRSIRRRERNKCSFVSRKSRLRHYGDLLGSHLQKIQKEHWKAQDEVMQIYADVKKLRARAEALSAQLRRNPAGAPPF